MFLFCGHYIRTVAIPELSANRLTDLRKKIVHKNRPAGAPAGVCTVCTMCTMCTHSVRMPNVYNFGAGTAVTVRQYRMSARCMATSDIYCLTSSSGFSIRIFHGVEFAQFFLITRRRFRRHRIVSVHPGIVNCCIGDNHIQEWLQYPVN